MKLIQRNLKKILKFSIHIVIFATILWLLIKFIFMSSYQYYLSEKDNFNQKKSELAELSNQSQNMIEHSKVLNSEASISMLRTFFNDTQIKLVDISYDGKEQIGDIYLFNYSLVLKGNYLSALKFIERLSSLPFKSIWYVINYNADQYPQGTLRLKLGLLAYE